MNPGHPRTPLPEDDEDTIELELTGEEMARLSRAAAKAQGAAGNQRFRPWPLAFVAAVIGIAALVIWRPARPRLAAQPIAPTAVVKTAPTIASQPAPAASPPAAPAVSSGPPVRVRNPFDQTEIFEFPPGTTRAEARRNVSQLLLQRAVDRGDQADRAQE